MTEPNERATSEDTVYQSKDQGPAKDAATEPVERKRGRLAQSFVAVGQFAKAIVFAPLIMMTFAWIVVESVIARWHYLIDLPVGFAIAILVIWMTNRLCAWRLAESRLGIGALRSRGGQRGA